ncbi:hypothetical protein IMG5_002740 [Ichthyophthirius multifiliis]|uniref:Uncharacterized protein n=1 Tax=Ichthyophthirius multifiliis TaxID=5932 RepID=G0QJ60_ICHMU|nr:hypothetical protein IMG5_002740 [Ichthyophthirius multifiliis]EGR34741.1 hypothetical protein IMG5_002740 [Ichthyophthirius multifiliis]|eukprot:XP_004040045.1 hypothetical protein IMG5_002740 [Ichthyophthirius multifiliis]
MIRSIIGIECGNKKTVISKIDRNGLSNIPSDSSNREIPSVIVYTEKNRIFSEQALDRIKAYTNSAIIYPYRLCVQDEYQKGYFLFQYDEKDNMGIINGEKWYVFQILASYFTYLDQLISKNSEQYVCVISVPNYFSQKEKYFFQKALQIAKLPCLKIVEEHMCIAYSYLQTQKNVLKEQGKKTILFIDLGETQTSAFIYLFDNTKGTLLQIESQKNLGLRDIDRYIYEYLAKKYTYFSKLNKKTYLRVLEQIEKLRKVLSSNSEANLHIEYITQDEDLDHYFSRKEFENIISDNFMQDFMKFLNQFSQQNLNIDEIELIGSGSRIPLILQKLKEVFQRQYMGIILQNGEQISRGSALVCALQASQINPFVKIENYKVQSLFTEQDQLIEVFLGQTLKKGEALLYKGKELPFFFNIEGELQGEENSFLSIKFGEIIYKTEVLKGGSQFKVVGQINECKMLEIEEVLVDFQEVSVENSLIQDSQMIDFIEKEKEMKERDLNFGDGSRGIFSLFQKEGANKVGEYLNCFNVTNSFSLEIGGNQLSDSGIKCIFDGIQKYISLREFKINLESNLKSKNANNITEKSI